MFLAKGENHPSLPTLGWMSQWDYVRVEGYSTRTSDWHLPPNSQQFHRRKSDATGIISPPPPLPLSFQKTS